MKKRKILHTFIEMAKYTTLGLIIQSFLCGLLIAGESSAQESIENVYLDFKVKNADIVRVFSKIEKATGFDFSYRRDDVADSGSFTLDFKNISLGDLLRTLSREGQLSFKRVNQSIGVSKLDGFTLKKPTVVETDPQRVVVSGKVTSAEDGLPIPGVNILEKGTLNGTTTDFDGIYRIEVSEGATLVFSYIGYEKQEVEVGNRTNTIKNIKLGI